MSQPLPEFATDFTLLHANSRIDMWLSWLINETRYSTAGFGDQSYVVPKHVFYPSGLGINPPPFAQYTNDLQPSGEFDYNVIIRDQFGQVLEARDFKYLPGLSGAMDRITITDSNSHVWQLVRYFNGAANPTTPEVTRSSFGGYVWVCDDAGLNENGQTIKLIKAIMAGSNFNSQATITGAPGDNLPWGNNADAYTNSQFGNGHLDEDNIADTESFVDYLWGLKQQLAPHGYQFEISGESQSGFNVEYAFLYAEKEEYFDLFDRGFILNGLSTGAARREIQAHLEITDAQYQSFVASEFPKITEVIVDPDFVGNGVPLVQSAIAFVNAAIGVAEGSYLTSIHDYYSSKPRDPNINYIRLTPDLTVHEYIVLRLQRDSDYSLQTAQQIASMISAAVSNPLLIPGLPALWNDIQVAGNAIMDYYTGIFHVSQTYDPVFRANNLADPDLSNPENWDLPVNDLYGTYYPKGFWSIVPNDIQFTATSGTAAELGITSVIQTGTSGNDSYDITSSSVLISEQAGHGTDTVFVLKGQVSETYYLDTNVENMTLQAGISLVVQGNSLDNVITADGAASTLKGSSGDDTYIIQNASAQIVENASEGTDSVQSSVSYTLGSNLENLTLTGTTNINGTGNSLNNVITGNEANNILQTGSGADTLNGGNGNDTLQGEGGDDSYTGFTDNSGADIVDDSSGTDSADFGSLNTTDATWEALDSNTDGYLDQLKLYFSNGNNVTFKNYFDNTTATLTGIDSGAGLIESLVFNDDNDVIFSEAVALANAGNNQNLVGSDSVDDSLTGGNGNDTLIGEDGQDTLTGGAGNDTLEGKSGWDRYVFHDGWGQDIIQNEWAGGDLLDFSNVASNLIINVAGGGFGDEVTDGTNTVNWSSGDILEYVIGGSGHDSISGDTGDDDLTGSDGNDTLSGAAGNDWLDGGAGNDSLSGGSDDDTYIGFSNSSGADVIDDTSGADLADFTGQSTSTVTWGAIDSDNDGFVDQLKIDFGSGHSVSINNYFDDTASTASASSAGSGLIESLSFDDDSDVNYSEVQTLVGSNASQAMVIQGTDDSEALNGSVGDDVITAGDGQDTITGGTGNDTLKGQNGWDKYVFSNTWGQDVITDEGAGGDWLDFSAVTSNLTITFSGGGIGDEVTDGTNTVNWAGDIQLEYVISGSGNDSITGDSTDNSISAGSGADTLIGANGNDYLEGGAGSDSLQGGAGDDIYTFADDQDADIIDDSSGTGDSATFSGLDTTDATWTALDSNSDTYLDHLKLDFGNGNNVTIKNYFNNTATTVSASSSGTGLIESLYFNNYSDINFSDVQLLFANMGGTPDQTLEGTDDSETLTGGADDDLINGYDGQDTLTGGTGNDTLNGQNGWDRYVFTNSWGQDVIADEYAGGDWIDLSSVTSNLTINVAGGAGDEVTDGTNTINWANDIVFEYIISGGGNDTIQGSSNNDYIEGGAGNDSLLGGVGDDIYGFMDENGADTIDDASGTGDSASFSGLNTSDATWTAIDSDSDTYLDQLKIDFGSGNQVIVKNYFNNTATTLAGSEAGVGLIESLSFDNISDVSFSDAKAIIDGSNSQNFYGTSGNDSLLGGAGNDVLVGYDNQDTLNGAAGNDSLEGQDGWDTYIFNDGWGQDIIQDEWSGGDFLDFSSVTTDLNIQLTDSSVDPEVTDGTNTVNWDENVELEYVISGSGNDFITGNDIVNEISGGDGDDILVGAGGDDYLEGGDGDDTYVVDIGTGEDVIIDSEGTDKILFGTSVSQNNIAFYMDNGDLLIGYTNSSSDLVTVQSQSTSASAIEHIQLSTGYYMTDADINQVISDMANYASTHSISFTSLDDVKNDSNLMAIVNGGWHS